MQVRISSTNLTKSALQWFGLSDMAHAIDKILAGADREHIDAFECVQTPQDIWEAELIPRSEANHLIEPGAHQ